MSGDSGSVSFVCQALVEDWDRKLTLFSRTLDEWLLCQRNWLYLETIFSAADIQRYPTNAPVTFDCVSVCMSFLWWWWRRFSLQPISRGTRPMLLSLLIVSLCACLFCGGGGDDFLCSRYPEVPDQCSCHF